MYSRFPRHSERPIQIPEHYSGCAFSENEPIKSSLPKPPPPEQHDDAPTEAQPPRTRSELPSLFGNSMSLFGGGLNFEELLLIGLILLLSHSEQDSDVILWLALLLFCK
ncbi:MAG: hypothetical protein IKC59_02305 [Clostridia bacterium]|nr:hypothetical protein [Clostridia bacterium]